MHLIFTACGESNVQFTYDPLQRTYNTSIDGTTHCWVRDADGKIKAEQCQSGKDYKFYESMHI